MSTKKLCTHCNISSVPYKLTYLKQELCPICGAVMPDDSGEPLPLPFDFDRQTKLREQAQLRLEAERKTVVYGNYKPWGGLYR